MFSQSLSIYEILFKFFFTMSLKLLVLLAMDDMTVLHIYLIILFIFQIVNVENVI